MTLVVGINFNPFDSNLICLSVICALNRFFINLSSFFEREEVDGFLRSLRFLVFICVLVIFLFSLIFIFAVCVGSVRTFSEQTCIFQHLYC